METFQQSRSQIKLSMGAASSAAVRKGPLKSGIHWIQNHPENEGKVFCTSNLVYACRMHTSLQAL